MLEAVEFNVPLRDCSYYHSAVSVGTGVGGSNSPPRGRSMPSGDHLIQPSPFTDGAPEALRQGRPFSCWGRASAARSLSGAQECV